MREILFRGKRSDNGEWIEGCYLDRNNLGIFFDDTEEEDCKVHIFSVNSSTIGQCTGQTDKHGKKIFEGDILKTDLYGEPLLVIFNEGCAAFQILFNDGYSEGFLERYSDINHLEIVGNIHDNPELLKGE